MQGMGGIGKTELALQYAIAQFNLEQYPGGVCWLRARGQNIISEITGFAQTHLGLTISDELNEQQQVEYCWGQWPDGDVLVVLDDVTDFKAVEPNLPPSNPRFKVLITTRLKLGRAVSALSIEELDNASAIALLQTVVGDERVQSQRSEAEALCTWVGNLPLGLELLGHSLANRPDWSIQKLLDRLQKNRLEAKGLTQRDSGMTAQLGVAAALELSWVELNEAEKELACLLGMFAIAPIPWILVEACLLETDRDDLEDSRDDGLIHRHLLRRVGQGTYQLHQTVQEFFRFQLEQRQEEERALQECFRRAMVSCAQSIGESPTLIEISRKAQISLK